MPIPGQIILTFEVLAKALGLNGEHKVVAVVPQTAQDIASGRFSILVDGPAFNQHIPRHAAPQAVLWKADDDVVHSWQLQRMMRPECENLDPKQLQFYWDSGTKEWKCSLCEDTVPVADWLSHHKDKHGR